MILSFNNLLRQVLMIGDDLVNDVGGAQHCGMKGIQVRTGKYRLVMSFISTKPGHYFLSATAGQFWSKKPAQYHLVLWLNLYFYARKMKIFTHY